jgi:two-component system response regulator TctD
MHGLLGVARNVPMRILCIEDNPTLARLMKAGLGQVGFAVDHTATAGDGLHAATTMSYGVIVLDLGLPDLDGLALLKKLRATRNATPVLILSARGKSDERVAGLEAGADDYLAKPFELPELVARLRALLRRPATMVPVELAYGNLVLRPGTHTAVVDGRETQLPRREAALLEHLLRNQGRPVPKSAIEDSLYAFGEEVASNAVEVHVHFLRKRLAALGALLRIETIRGTGYVLRAAEAPSPSRG